MVGGRWWVVGVGVMVVSGCSSFACGLTRLIGRLSTRIAIFHGSRFRLSRLSHFSGVVSDPKPNVPSRTKLLVSIVEGCTNEGPVLKIYLNRRTVNRTFNTGLAGLSRICRKMTAPYARFNGSPVFRKLPGHVRVNECRS